MLPTLVACVALVLLTGGLARRLGQPHVVAYILVGVLLGPDGLSLLGDEPTITRLGEVGVILLLFFAGMEVDLRKLVTGWRISVVGTVLQVVASVLLVAALGIPFGWSSGRIVLLGFAISLSSTALVLTMLRQWREVDTPAGQDAIGILLVQDIVVIPMLIVVGLLAGETPSLRLVGTQLFGGAVAVALVVALVRGKSPKLPFAESLRRDHELQIFAALFLCFGFAWFSAMLGLSSALGAFLAGLVVTCTRETEWVHHSLEPYRVLFVAVFFVSVGLLLDLDFVREHALVLGLLTLAAFASNTLINALILRALGRGWRTSVYSGALLSQIGEFSFVLAAVGKEAGLIQGYAYNGVIGVIVGTLLLGPLWVQVWRPFRGASARPVESPPPLEHPV